MTLNEQEIKLAVGFAQNKPLFDLVKRIVLSQGTIDLPFLAQSLNTTNEKLWELVRGHTVGNLMVENAFTFMANLSNKVDSKEINEAR